jgi:acetyl esterase/lipase
MAQSLTLLSNSSEKVTVFVPASWRKDGTRRAVLFCHAAGGDAIPAASLGAARSSLADQLGTVVIAGDLSSGHAWCNAASIQKITDHWNWAKTNLGVKTDKMILSGASMGGGTAVTYAGQNPGNVAALQINIPTLNVDDIHDNDRGGFASDIETAYGGLAGWNAAEPTQNPVNQIASIASAQIPTILYANELDSICLVQYARQLAHSGSHVFYQEIEGQDHFPITDDEYDSRLLPYVT